MLWMPIHDRRNKFQVSFSDPYRLGSLIMYCGKKLKIEALSDVLIDSFRKGILSLLNALKCNDFKNLTLDTLIENTYDMTLHLIDVPTNLVKYSIFHELSKNPEKNKKAL